MSNTILIRSCLTLLLLTQTACGVLLTNIKPVDEKSETYGITDLAKESPDWLKLEQFSDGKKPQDPNATPSEVADVSYQSKKTASIISVNSACRPTVAVTEKSLQEFTNLLFLGISDISVHEEKELTVQKAPALQTTVKGKLNDEPVMLRTVVLHKNACVYDLMYVARPDNFSENEDVFSHFVASLKLKE